MLKLTKQQQALNEAVLQHMIDLGVPNPVLREQSNYDDWITKADWSVPSNYTISYRLYDRYFKILVNGPGRDNDNLTISGATFCGPVDVLKFNKLMKMIESIMFESINY